MGAVVVEWFGRSWWCWRFRGSFGCAQDRLFGFAQNDRFVGGGQEAGSSPSASSGSEWKARRAKANAGSSLRSEWKAKNQSGRLRVVLRQKAHMTAAATMRAMRRPDQRPAAPSFLWKPSQTPSGMPMSQ